MSEKILYWNRRPGKFVNKNTGEEVLWALAEGGKPVGPAFMGSVHEWYETLVETLIDLRNQLHREAGKNSRQIKVYVHPDVRRTLESTVLYKPSSGEGPRSKVATLYDMDVFVSNKVRRFEIEMEFKTDAQTKRGKVLIQED